MMSCIVALPKRIVGAKIALLDFSLQKTKMKMGVQMLIEDPEQLEKMRQRYWDGIDKCANPCSAYFRQICLAPF